jgi:hypothetical protein
MTQLISMEIRQGGCNPLLSSVFVSEMYICMFKQARILNSYEVIHT